MTTTKTITKLGEIVSSLALLSSPSSLDNKTYFSELAQNASAITSMNINNISTQDFRYVSTSNNTFISVLSLYVSDNAGFNKNNFGYNVMPTNGFRIFYDTTGSSKTYITSSIKSNKVHASWADDYTYYSDGPGDNFSIAKYNFIYPIKLDLGGTIGVELGIDDFSNLTDFTAKITGFTIA